MADATYRCSGAYFDQELYAYYTCPFYTDLCGTTDVFSLAAVGDKADILLNMSAGQVCFFEVDALTTAPGFKINSQDGDLTIGYVEVNNATAFAGVTAYKTGPSNTPDYLAGSPLNAGPPRSQCVSTATY
jgi:hypothetical protein